MKAKKVALLLSIIITLIIFVIRIIGKETLLVDEVVSEIEVREVALTDTTKAVSTIAVPAILTNDEPIIKREIGSIIVFGEREWLILEIDENRAKIISVDIIEKRAYHDTDTPTTWATSNIRNFLNYDFYNSFNDYERASIVEISSVNENNQWHGTNGGEPTQDKIFLLSISEVIKYFGDSNQLSNRPRNARIISDKYDEKRIAHYNKTASWWWLRSPGSFGFRAARINPDGSLDMSSTHIHDAEGGIRPAIWIDIMQNKLK